MVKACSLICQILRSPSGELLFTGVTMYIVPHDKPDAKAKYRVVGIERDSVVIMLDTNYSNDVAQHLIENKLIPVGGGGALRRSMHG